MTRVFCIPGIAFLFCAFVLSFIVSISLPFLTALDITRVHFGSQVSTSQNISRINQIRFGIWAYCDYATTGDRICSTAGHAYTVGIFETESQASITIGRSWSRGLAVHPVATSVTFIALLLSFSTHATVTLLASVTSFLAGLLTLIAFAIDIALFARVKHEIKRLPNAHGHTTTGPGFWITFVSLILLLLAGCTVCFGRRKDRMAGATSHPMKAPKKPWSRFGGKT